MTSTAAVSLWNRQKLQEKITVWVWVNKLCQQGRRYVTKVITADSMNGRLLTESLFQQVFFVPASSSILDSSYTVSPDFLLCSPRKHYTHTHTQEVCPTINGNMGHTKAEKCPKGMCLCWRDRDIQGLCEFRLLSVWNRDERSTTPLLRLKVWMGWRGQGGSAGLQKLVNSSQKHLFNSHFLSTFSYLRVHKVN